MFLIGQQFGISPYIFSSGWNASSSTRPSEEQLGYEEITLNVYTECPKKDYGL
jgi:hypothetical protein